MTYPLFITGANGRIGQTLIRSLKRDFQSLQGDLFTLHQYPDQIPNGAIVLHLAAKTHARSSRIYDRANVEGTKILLDAAKKRLCRHFIFVSTRAIDPTGGPYARSKRLGEDLVRTSGLPYTILRFGEVTGAAQAGIDGLVSSITHNRPVFLPGDGRDLVAPLPISDAVRILHLFIDHEPQNKTTTFTGPEISLEEFVNTQKKLLHSRSVVIHIPFFFLRIIALVVRFLPIGFSPDQIDRIKSPKIYSSKRDLRNIFLHFKNGKPDIAPQHTDPPRPR